MLATNVAFLISMNPWQMKNEVYMYIEYIYIYIDFYKNIYT